jgi:hypothetical protein
VPRGAGKGRDFYLGRFPLASADFWTSDHLSERSRMLFWNARARNTHVEATSNHSLSRPGPTRRSTRRARCRASTTSST